MNNTTKQFHPSEITEEEEEEDESTLLALNPKVLKERIRRIIDRQKSLYFSSSSSSSSASSLSSSSAVSSSSFSSSRRTSLLDLMRGGSTSLNRLFDMEHTRLSTHFNEYSGSPVIKPIYLWGSDEEEAKEGSRRFSPWANVKSFKSAVVGGSLSNDGGFAEGRISPELAAKRRRSRRRLRRTKTFRNLPGFFRLRLKRLRIIICGKKF